MTPRGDTAHPSPERWLHPYSFSSTFSLSLSLSLSSSHSILPLSPHRTISISVFYSITFFLFSNLSLSLSVFHPISLSLIAPSFFPSLSLFLVLMTISHIHLHPRIVYMFIYLL